ncbi:NUDIX domain-containing protein [Gracilibacillus oryzae]|uniref:NUDIX domain-containing protein n=1 Tax=Gracilibacillus oryzae TaxID=1672701 RepID=UPI002B1BD61E|nr:NUDIX domain-containing protein [Gracilibacillus oryzae]
MEFHDQNGLHYNLPGGGVEQLETIHDAVKREAKEEADVEVEVGDLAFVYEYAPHRNNYKYGDIHSLSLYFSCKRHHDTKAQLPKNPDPNQTGIKWIPLKELDTIVLYPNIKKEILNYLQKQTHIKLIEEEHLLSQ